MESEQYEMNIISYGRQFIPSARFPYPAPVVIQWWSSGNPTCLEFRPHAVYTVMSLEKELLVASAFPLVFQLPSSGVSVCSNYAN